MHEDVEVHIGMILVRGNGEIHELLDWLMIQILQMKPSDTSVQLRRIENHCMRCMSLVTWNGDWTSMVLSHTRHVRPNERARAEETVASGAKPVRH